MFFQSAPVPLKQIDEQGLIIRANQAEYSLLGYSADEMVGKPLWTFIADEDEYMARRRHRELLEGKSDFCSLQRRYKRKSGEYLICDARIRVIRDASGLGRGLYVALFDITQQLQEDAVRDDRIKWMESCFRSLHNPTLVLDTLGCIRYMNRACEDLLGWKESEVAGSIAEELVPWYDLVAYDGSVPDWQRALTGSWFGATTISTKGGIAKRVEMSATPIICNDGLVIGIVAIFRPMSKGSI